MDQTNKSILSCTAELFTPGDLITVVCEHFLGNELKLHIYARSLSCRFSLAAFMAFFVTTHTRLSFHWVSNVVSPSVIFLPLITLHASTSTEEGMEVSTPQAGVAPPSRAMAVS